MAKFAERTITDFRSKLANGGVRSNLFEVEINDIPGGGLYGPLMEDA